MAAIGPPDKIVQRFALVTEASGTPLPYGNMGPEAFRSALLGAGLPELGADIMSNTDAGVAKGGLFEEGGNLRRLIGRATTPYQDTITSFVRDLPVSERADA